METLHLCHSGKPFSGTELLKQADPNRWIHSECRHFNTITTSSIRPSHRCMNSSFQAFIATREMTFIDFSGLGNQKSLIFPDIQNIYK